MYIVHMLPAMVLYMASKISWQKKPRTGIYILFHFESGALLSAPYSKLVI